MGIALWPRQPRRNILAMCSMRSNGFSTQKATDYPLVNSRKRKGSILLNYFVNQPTTTWLKR